ncbi:hypothetical protein D3C74_329200 [compost metagenome]
MCNRNGDPILRHQQITAERVVQRLHIIQFTQKSKTCCAGIPEGIHLFHLADQYMQVCLHRLEGLGQNDLRQLGELWQQYIQWIIGSGYHRNVNPIK